MFEKEEHEMHFEAVITVTQILKFQVCGVGGQVGETEMAIQKQLGGGTLPKHLGAAAIFHILKKYLEFYVSYTVDCSILEG